jgi:hypothetical protein
MIKMDLVLIWLFLIKGEIKICYMVNLLVQNVAKEKKEM